MATCDKCLCNSVCYIADQKVSIGTKVRETIHGCKHFKPKSRYIEAFCEECNQFRPYYDIQTGVKRCSGFCKLHKTDVSSNGYCDKGRKK